MTVWMATGSLQNSKTSFEKGKWGVNKRLRKTWERVAKDDTILFYISNPVCGIVGAGIVSRQKR